MTFDEYMAREGWAADGSGGYGSLDGDGNFNYIDPGSLEIHTANWKAANPAAPVTDPSFWGQAGGRRDDIVIDGVQQQQLATWFPNDPDQQKALNDEIALLKSHGVEPVYDERYGWIAPDRGVDARVAAAHPDVAKSSIFEFAPFILGGGLAALAAGAGMAGAGALASEAAPAAVPAAAGALPSAGTIATGAGKGALTGGVTSALQGGNPITGALTGAVTGGATSAAAPFVSGLTPYSAVNQAIGNAALSAGTAGLTGGDPVTAVGNSVARSGVNAASGALWNAAKGVWEESGAPKTSGALPEAPQVVSENYWNMTAAAGNGTQTDAGPVGTIGIYGPVIYRTVNEALVDKGDQGPWTNVRVAENGDILATGPDGGDGYRLGRLAPDAIGRQQVETAEQAQQEQERQYAEAQRIEQERRAEIEAEAQRQFQIQQQIETEYRRQVEAAEQAQQEQERQYAAAQARIAQEQATARAQAEAVARAQAETQAVASGAGQSPFAGTGEATYTPTSNETAGALPNSEDTNMAESNWWGELTSEFGNAGEVANVEPYGGLNEIDQWLSDIGATRNPDGSINWESVDNSDTLQSLGTIDEGPGALDFSNAANSLGLQQMGEAAGLKGDALAKFVASGGTQGSTRAGGGGIGTGAGIPFGASGGAGGSATNANTININNGGALGNLPSWALPALVAGLALDNPDRTSTTKVEYPDWYNTGAKSALAQADKFGALGPDSIAPLSGNENEAIQMAKDSTGQWIPQLDKAASTLDESKYFYNKAGALNDAVPGFVNAASGRADQAMPYFGAAGALAGSVPGYLDRARGQVDASMPYFDKAGQTADTVSGYLNRATGQVDAAMPYFGKAAGQVDASMPYFGKAGDMADSVSGYLNKSGALADQAAGGIPSVNLSAYMNPYLDNVLAPIARRNELAKAAALNDIRAKAGMRGAFGGSRSTLLETETAGAADRNLNEAEAGIRANAFNTGLNTAQADLNRILQASGQYGALGGVAGNTAGIYGGIGKTVADTGNIYSGVGKNIADTAGTFTTAGNVAGNTANIYGNIGKGIADTAGVFNNSGVVATGAANSLTGAGKGIADTADVFNKSAGALTSAANADTNIGRSLTDASSGYRANAGAFGNLTDADIARLMGTGATSRSVDQAKLNAPLTAIGGYAAALRGAGTPGATTTNVAPEASKIGQAATGLGALIGANKAGLI